MASRSSRSRSSRSRNTSSPNVIPVSDELYRTIATDFSRCSTVKEGKLWKIRIARSDTGECMKIKFKNKSFVTTNGSLICPQKMIDDYMQFVEIYKNFEQLKEEILSNVVVIEELEDGSQIEALEDGSHIEELEDEQQIEVE